MGHLRWPDRIVQDGAKKLMFDADYMTEGKKRKVGGIRYVVRSLGRSSSDSLAFCACETPRR